MVKKVEPTYQTRDGQTFSSKDEAEQHEAILDLVDAKDKADRNLVEALGEHLKTADGQPLQFDRYSPFYYLVKPYYEMPRIETVSLWLRDLHLPMDGYIYFYTTNHSNESVRKAYAIKRLYSSERAANLALVDALKEYKEFAQQKINDIIEKYGEPE